MGNEDKDQTARNTIAANLVRLREAQGWSTKDLAGKAGIAIDEMIAFERAEKSPALSDMRRLAAAFAVPLSVLFEGC